MKKVAEIVERLHTIKVTINELKAEEVRLLKELAFPIVREKRQYIKKSRKGISGWAKRKMSKAQKTVWEGYTPEQRAHRVQKALAGRKGKVAV